MATQRRSVRKVKTYNRTHVPPINEFFSDGRVFMIGRGTYSKLTGPGDPNTTGMFPILLNGEQVGAFYQDVTGGTRVLPSRIRYRACIGSACPIYPGVDAFSSSSSFSLEDCLNKAYRDVGASRRRRS